jgi:acyl-coenzyme A synthetase/AMP-(fatty) acid ligase/acyl carrier protein
MQQASFSFDAFVEEVYPILFRGGKIAIACKEVIMDPNAVLNFLLRRDITIISVSPLLLNEIDKMPIPGSIRLLISGGDVLKGEYIRNLSKKKQVYNTYGPTETTVCASYYKCSQADYINVPIGKPIANYRVYILNRTGDFLPIGVQGELCIAGDGVTRGYLNLPELTAEKFQRFNGSYGSNKTYLLYKTGDLCKWLPDGNIEFLGRIDHQVKIRGFRIELGEIEAQLLGCPGIARGVVIEREIGERKKSLCAYLVSEKELDISELKSILSKTLPGYMIPSYFIRVEKIPLNVNGKFDRKALLSLKIQTRTEVDYIMPRNEIEKKIAETWKEILGLEKVGVNENFFDLGGTSLDIIRLNVKFKEIFNEKETVLQMFRYPTIRSFAEYLNRERGEIAAGNNVVSPVVSTVPLHNIKQSRQNQKNKRRSLR